MSTENCTLRGYRRQGRAGWRRAVGPNGLGTVAPYAGLVLADENERSWRAGARWSVAPDVSFGIEGTRSDNASDTEHGLMLRGSLGW